MIKSSVDIRQVNRFRHHVTHLGLRHKHTSAAYVRRKFLEYFRFQAGVNERVDGFLEKYEL